MSTDIHSIRKQLDVLEEELIARVPEHLFVQHILPIIAFEEGHKSLEPWQVLAGSVFNRMKVIDPSGATLFILPSIAVSPKTSGAERNSMQSLFEVMEGYAMRARVHPNLAIQYLTHELKDKVVTDPVNLAELKKIDEILVRYGKKPHLPQGISTASDKPTASSGFAEEVGDDL